MAKVDVGEDGKVDAGAVKSLLKRIEAEYEDTLDNLRTANAESKKRKELIRDELKPKIEQYEDEIIVLKKKANDETLKEELETLRGFKKTYLKSKRDELKTQFGKIMSHPNFEKAKDRFIIPEKADGDEDYDFSKLKDDEIEKNINTLNDLNSLDYFAVQDDNNNRQKPPVDGNRFKQINDDKPVEIENRSTLQTHLRQEFEKAEQQSD